MAEYIKRALVAWEIRKLLRVRESSVDIFQAGFEYGVNRAWVKINKIPAADVAQVVHGHWECGYQCSVCGDRHGPYNSRHKPYYNYCHNCGAKMDEEVNDT